VKDNAVETTRYSLSGVPPAAPDRRGGDRYLSLLRVGALMIEDRRELCLIRNISASGMMIRSYSLIPVGKSLAIELKQGTMVSGTAQWADGDLVGICFDESIDVLGLLAPSATESKPRMPRIDLDCAAIVRDDANLYRTRAVNISQGGICVRTKAAMEPGSPVTITLVGLPPIRGTVTWRDGDEYGLGFNHVLPIAELMRLLRERQHASRRPG
jgi:hypothetical protein